MVSVSGVRRLFSLRNTILIAFGVSGMCALIYEMVWGRMLSLIFGSTVYAYATMLCAFMAGLALGSYWMGKRCDKVKNLLSYFAFFELGIGIYGILFIIFLGYAQYPYFVLYQAFNQNFPIFLFMQFLLYFVIMLIPTTLMGALFPIVAKIFTREMTALGKDIGTVYAANSVGSVLGPFLAAFILIPAIGVKNTALFAAFFNIMIALVVLYLSREKEWKPIAAVSLLFLFFGAGLKLPGMTFNTYYAGLYPDWASVEKDLRNTKILYFNDGPYSTVAVINNPNVPYTALTSDNRAEASTLLEDMQPQLLGGFIPTLLHKNPQQILLVGIGSGIMLGALETSNATQIHAVDINPAMLEAQKFFVPYNNNALNDSRVRIFLNDARNFLWTTSEKYDIIVNHPSPQSNSATSHLFTKEFFELGASKLKEDGLFVSVLAGAGFSKQDFKIELKTFSDVFPHTLVWITDNKSFQNQQSSIISILVGSKKPIELNANKIDEKMAASEKIRSDLGQINIYSAHDFVSLMVLNESQVEKLVAAEDGQNTDDWPVIEFTAPANLFYNEYLKLSDILQTHEGSIR